MMMLIMLFAVGGLLVSSYIYYKKRRHEKLVCLLRKDCDEVVRSRYSALLFGIPNEVLGMMYFGFVAVASVFLQLSLAVTVLGGIAAAFSLVLVFIQLAVIRRSCTYCLISAAISIIIFICGMRT